MKMFFLLFFCFVPGVVRPDRGQVRPTVPPAEARHDRDWPGPVAGRPGEGQAGATQGKVAGGGQAAGRAH